MPLPLFCCTWEVTLLQTYQRFCYLLIYNTVQKLCYANQQLWNDTQADSWHAMGLCQLFHYSTAVHWSIINTGLTADPEFNAYNCYIMNCFFALTALSYNMPNIWLLYHLIFLQPKFSPWCATNSFKSQKVNAIHTVIKTKMKWCNLVAITARNDDNDLFISSQCCKKRNKIGLQIVKFDDFSKFSQFTSSSTSNHRCVVSAQTSEHSNIAATKRTICSR